ncbi:MAG: hypothetical protein QOI63_667, partial [Thermoplasmata archaeon]|nr:hypothetical protein [Thermoplasmata archaeon]
MGKTYSWDDLQPKSAEGYTSSDLEEIPKAIGFLRKALGEEFVANGMHARHPMMFYVVNQAQWTRKWFAQFAKALQSTRHWANGDSLLERIRDPRKFREALSVLRAGVALEGAGFRIEVDPRIDSSKIPDLRIAAPNGDTLLVEVSELGPSQLETG